jgi:drug/metabolite transporter (DMT)-like permease
MSDVDSRTRNGLAAKLADFLSWKVLLAIFFWGISFPFTKAALVSFHPNGLVAVRMGLGVAVLALFTLVRRERWFVEPADRARSAWLGVILAVHLLMQAYAMTLTSSISSGWIIAFNPVVLALGGAAFLGERIRRLGWLGMAVATGGVVIVALEHPFDLSGATTGDLLIFLSCFTWPLFTLLSARPAASSGSLRVTSFAMVVAGVVNTIAAALTDFTIAPLTNGAVWAAIFLGVFCNGLSFVLWLAALDEEGAAKISAMLYFQPFITMFWAAWVDGESLSAHALLGGPIVILGVWLLRSGSPRHVRRRSVPAKADPAGDS